MRCIKIHTCASAPLSTCFALSPCTLDDLSPPGMKDQLLCLCPWPFSWHLLRGFTLIFLPFFRVINSSFLAESFWSACEHAVIPPTCWLPNLHLQLRLFSWIPDFYIPSPLSISTHIPIRQEWKAWAIGYVHGQADNGSSIFLPTGSAWECPVLHALANTWCQTCYFCRSFESYYCHLCSGGNCAG